MPRPTYRREDVLAAGLAVVAREGFAHLSARRVADELGSSTAPVYSNFANMEELAEAVKRAAVAELLATTRAPHTDDAFRNIGHGVLQFVWERPALYAALFLEDTGGDYDPGPEFMEALQARTDALPELDPLPQVERRIVLKKLALFTHGLATEICQGCREHCTLETLKAMMDEVGDAVLTHARAGVARAPEVAELLAAFWDVEPRPAAAADPGTTATEDEES